MSLTLQVLVNNKPGVLLKVVGLFSSRDINIESLTVHAADDQSKSQMVITADYDDMTLQQISSSLGEMPDVLQVELIRAAE